MRRSRPVQFGSTLMDSTVEEDRKVEEFIGGPLPTKSDSDYTRCHTGRINLAQNDIIKLFSVLAGIFMPSTVIASIYGMNFKANA